jgi:alpha-1,2-mannosyltransferase
VSDRDRPAELARAALPIIAIVAFALGLAGTLAAAGDTLGFDFRAYDAAIDRLAAGGPLYDMSYTRTGGFGLFYYPPTFAPLLVPWAFLAEPAATWSWIALSIVAFVIGVGIMPVSRSVRWSTLLLAGLSFPFVYAVKLGQVGPVLFLLFAIGWRWIDSAKALGGTAALGAAIKIQPGLVLVWAVLTRRFRVVLLGAIALLGLTVIATLMAGIGSWSDFLTLLRTVSDPITTAHNFTPGAIAYRLGLPVGLAAGIQVVNTVLAVGAIVIAVRWAPDEASYLVTVIASQLVSPILWDHYAMILLLPVAYLLSAGRWWAVAIPLATAWPLIGITPPIVYPIAFWVALLALLAVGRAARDPRTNLGERWAV